MGQDEFVAIDVETANGMLASICQIGAVRFRGGREIESISWLVDPRDFFDEINIVIHGISEEHVAGQPDFGARYPALRDFIGESLLVCHTHFDRIALAQACARSGVDPLGNGWLDSAKVARRTWPDVAHAGYGLGPLAARFAITFRHHDACEDARASGLVLLRAIADSGIPLANWPARAARPIAPDANRSAAREGSGEGPLLGECLVFTGTVSLKREDAADFAAALGAEVANSVTRRTTMLVVGEQDVRKLKGAAITAKHRKALDLIARGQPVRILAEPDFLALAGR